MANEKLVQFSSKLKEIDPYELYTSADESDYLGCGGFASVRICRLSEQDVVAKCFIISGRKEEKEKHINNVKREADVLTRIVHDNIVKIIGFTQWNHNHLAIILEFVACGSLDSLLNSEHELSWPQRLEFAKQLISAICYLHNHPSGKVFYHGDIKPDNVLLDIHLNVKLADFGSVNIIKASSVATVGSWDLAPTTQHTLRYVAPEVLEEKEAAPSGDMYSFSMFSYELSTRTRVYEGSTVRPEILSNAILSGTRPDLTKVELIKATLNDERDMTIFLLFTDLMVSCWNKDPTVRPTSVKVKEMLDVRSEDQPDIEKKEQLALCLLKKRQSTPPHKMTNLAQFAVNFVSATEDVNSSLLLPLKHESQMVPANQVQPFRKKSLEEIFHQIDGDRNALDMLQQYSSLVHETRTSDAERVAGDLENLLQGQVETTAEQLRTFAKKMLEKSRFLDAILLFRITAAYFANHPNPNKVVKGIELCAWGMMNTNEKMIQCDVTMKPVVRGHVLPLMRDLRRKIEDLENVERNIRTLNLALFSTFIEYSEHLVSDENAQNET